MNKYLFLLGVLFLLFPLGLKMWAGKMQVNVIETYQQDLKQTSQEKKDKIYQSAKEYNRNLYETGEINEVRYLEELNVFKNGIMGSLEIPKISLKLPVYHGIEEAVLASGIGHLPESSLPTGGENTHCVLTGHRGLPEAQLFTRLDELSKGDVFRVNINGHKLWYRVCEIQVIKPEEIEVLQIYGGKDLISLVTCTPYGINTHRLVVTGERIDKSKVTSEGLEKNMISKRDVGVLFLPAICLVPSIFQKWKEKRLKNRRCREDEKEKSKNEGYHICRDFASSLFLW